MNSFAKKLILLSLILGVSVFVYAGAVLAASDEESWGLGTSSYSFDVNKLKAVGQESYVPAANAAEDPQKGIIGILVKAVDLLVKFVGSIALIVFVIGALLTITSEGKEDRLEKGKTAMVYAIIGLVIAFFSFVIVTFVQSVLF